MKITFATVSAPGVKELIKIGEKINKDYNNILDLKLYFVPLNQDSKTLRKLSEDISNSDIVFVDLMGASPNVISFVYQGLELCKGEIIPYGNSGRDYLRLGKFTSSGMKNKSSDKKMDMSKMKKMQDMAEKMGKVVPGKMKDMRNYSLICKYFKVSDYENLKNMMYLLLRDYGGYTNLPEPEEPTELEPIALCNPDGLYYYEDYKELYEKENFSEDKPSIALLFYGHSYPTDTSKSINYIKNELKDFANIIPIAVSNTFGDEKNKLNELLLEKIPVKLDLILNFMSFRLGAGPMGGDAEKAIDLLKELNVPYMHPFFLSRITEDEWLESIEGTRSSDVMISIMLPELDGAIEIMPIGSVKKPEYNEDYQVEINELEVIEERVERLKEKCKKYINLRYKENKEKKVAIICYNYPPGESNLFGGAFLDTFESVGQINKRLKEEGYLLDGLTSEDLKEKFTIGKLVNSPKYGDYSDEFIRYNHRTYRKDIRGLKDYEDLIGKWGQSPGEIMSEGEDFLIPGVIDKNIFIGLQPSRGVHEDDDFTYHDKSLPPHHQYIAYYKWLEEEFKADMIIHVGTHGTLEFLKGKESGMSGHCYPDMLLGNIPHMYLYYVGNPSEATIAKRRSAANIVSYQPPVFTPGDLYGEYSQLMTLIDNYRQSTQISPQTSKEILKDILELSEKLNLGDDLDLIESELYRMKESLIPEGLHVLGKGYNDSESIEYAKGIIKYSLSREKSIRSILAYSEGYDLEDLEEKQDIKTLEYINKLSDEVFDYYVENNNFNKFNFNKDVIEDLKKSITFAINYAKSSMGNKELDGIIRVLNGEYNPAKMAGDIYRNPQILPTGYNLYQFDPRLIPTDAAYRRGTIIANNTIKAYLEEEGKYPTSTAVILWGIETSRTQGESLSQILSYLGIRVVNSGKNWNPKYEIIPLEELKRPRIDVTINICGFFRDMFPNLIMNLADILDELFEADEPLEYNYFKANSIAIYDDLINKGYPEEEARELCVSRIFGPKEGSYGTGITDIIDTKNWDEEEELATVFLDNLQHVYSRNYRGKKIDNLYKDNLKSVEIVSQIRSSHEYEITDLDHYYEFFGGLSKSVEMVRGKKAKMYITDVTTDRIVSESVEKSIGRGIRTRVLNPKWIDGLLKHDKHGAQEISDRFSNVMGLAATTNSVEQWVFNDMHTKYVEDEDIRDRLIENNEYAYMDILEQMMEYFQRGYWDASKEQIEEIKNIYLELENNIETQV